MSDNIATHDKPLAANGLISYRYPSQYGWVMIGAKNLADAVREANRSLSTGFADSRKMQVWSTDQRQYVTVK